MKRFRIDATFPELASGRAEHTTECNASTLTVAVYRSLKTIFQRPALKRKRVKSAQIRVTFLGNLENPSTFADRKQAAIGALNEMLRKEL